MARLSGLGSRVSPISIETAQVLLDESILYQQAVNRLEQTTGAGAPMSPYHKHEIGLCMQALGTFAVLPL